MNLLGAPAFFLLMSASIVTGELTQDAASTPCDHDNGGCSSLCLISTNKSNYSCACPTGIQLLSDKKTCADEGQSLLLVIDLDKIRSISLDTPKYPRTEWKLGGSWNYAIDYDPVDRHIYWVDTYVNVIRRAYLNGSGKEDIISTVNISYGGIAIDYLARKLYWTNYERNLIEVCNLNGTNRKVLISTEVNVPSDIVVHPENERIYWTHRHRRIESSSLSGNNRSIIIDSNLGMFSSLALDKENRKIYWGDWKLNKIEMANLDGSNRRVLISIVFQSSAGLSVLGDYIYWSTPKKKMIERVDKITGDNREVIAGGLTLPRSLKAIIVHKVRELKCKKPTVPINGFLVVDQNELSTSLGSKIRYECFEKYVLVGERKAKCIFITGKAGWSSPPPQCIVKKCGPPDHISNGYYEGDGFFFGQQIVYHCNTGYSLVGTATRICGASELWSGNPPKCTILKCRGPAVPKNGFLRGDLSLSLGSEIEYGCDVKYEPVGRQKAKCFLLKGKPEWSIPPIRCIVKNCSQPDPISNGYYTGSDFSFGRQIIYYCNSGYSLVGTAARECGVSLEWSGNPPLCEELKCKVPTMRKNGFLRGDLSMSLGSEIEYGCDVKYQPVGELKAKCVLVNDRPEWSASPPQCIVKNCSQPDPISNGYYTGSDFSFGRQIIYYCNSGYSLVGTAARECGVSQKWSGNLPLCEELKCKVPTVPKNGFLHGDLRLSLGSEIEYGCDVMYTLVGGQTAKCISLNGHLEWSSPQPQCIERTCDPPLTPKYGFVTISPSQSVKNSVNTVAIFTCQLGYRLLGNENTTCVWIEGKVQWSNPTPECINREQCKALSIDFYDYIKYKPEMEIMLEEESFQEETEHRNGTIAKVKCERGYEIYPLHATITNEATAVCENGQWKPEMTNCTQARCSCTDLPKEMRQRHRKHKYCETFIPSGSNGWTECDEGYEAKRNYGTICAWGIWIIHTPETPDNKCNRRKSVNDCHLDLTGKEDLSAIYRDEIFEDHSTSFVHRSLIKFTCKTFDYTLEGAKNATCNDGQLTEEVPKCKRVSAIDSLHPPFLWVYSSTLNRMNADDGRVILPKRKPIIITCLSPEERQLTLNERKIIGKQLLKVIHNTKDQYSSIMVVDHVNQKADAIVECTNSNGISTKLHVVVADTCEVEGDELSRRRLQVVPDSKQRVYVEGDRIQLECSLNNYRTHRFTMTCNSGQKWTYGNNMAC